jgi:hypothetical protein
MPRTGTLNHNFHKLNMEVLFEIEFLSLKNLVQWQLRLLPSEKNKLTGQLNSALAYEFFLILDVYRFARAPIRSQTRPPVCCGNASLLAKHIAINLACEDIVRVEI